MRLSGEARNGHHRTRDAGQGGSEPGAPSGQASPLLLPFLSFFSLFPSPLPSTVALVTLMKQKVETCDAVTVRNAIPVRDLRPSRFPSSFSSFLFPPPSPSSDFRSTPRTGWNGSKASASSFPSLLPFLPVHRRGVPPSRPPPIMVLVVAIEQSEGRNIARPSAA